MARAVGDDELALVGREVPVRDVDRDALLTLGLEAIDEDVTQCLPARWLASWIVRAKTSLPLPVSPSSSTEASLPATRSKTGPLSRSEMSRSTT